jgi:hypothetical protein
VGGWIFETVGILPAESLIGRLKNWWVERKREKRRQLLRAAAEAFDPRVVQWKPAGVAAGEGLPLHFFTIVLNGRGFLERQWEMMRGLQGDWVWHVVEGAAELVGDTAWSVQSGGALREEFHRGGRSVDGTLEWLDELSRREPDRVKVYGKEGLWQGKREMVQAPMGQLPEECLLWQLDVDELWQRGQIEEVWGKFVREPEWTGAQFFCRFFVAPNRILLNGGKYGNDPVWEWRRVWRYRRGDEWGRHEPPRLWRQTNEGPRDLFDLRPMSWGETVERGWVFDHFAYVEESQVRFKEVYYGYAGAVEGWRRLVQEEADMVEVSEYLPWIPRGVMGWKLEGQG